MNEISASRRRQLHRYGVGLEWFTVIWNVLEAIVAILAGLAASSTALIAFGTDSMIEITAALALLIRFSQAGPHATDIEHSRAEKRALYLVSVTFFLLAIYILIESIISLLQQEIPETSKIGLILAILSLIVMPALAYAKQSVGRKMGSKALQADAIETWVCAYLSLALLGGVGLYYAFGWWWADAVGALAMLPVIIWQGWETLEDAREE